MNESDSLEKIFETVAFIKNMVLFKIAEFSKFEFKLTVCNDIITLN